MERAACRVCCALACALALVGCGDAEVAPERASTAPAGVPLQPTGGAALLETDEGSLALRLTLHIPDDAWQPTGDGAWSAPHHVQDFALPRGGLPPKVRLDGRKVRELAAVTKRGGAEDRMYRFDPTALVITDAAGLGPPTRVELALWFVVGERRAGPRGAGQADAAASGLIRAHVGGVATPGIVLVSSLNPREHHVSQAGSSPRWRPAARCVSPRRRSPRGACSRPARADARDPARRSCSS